MDTESLFLRALEAADTSYSPYSHFRVGAAILFDDGTVFSGTNIENRSFGLTICAERNALAQAIHQRAGTIVAIAVATPDSLVPVSPCGACRQVLSEFAKPETIVLFGSRLSDRVFTTMGALFPFDSLHDLADRTH